MDDVYSRAGNDADPPYLSPDYVGTRTRSPKRPLILIPQTLSEITGPVYGHSDVKVEEADLTIHHASEPLGERIIVKGRVLDEGGRPGAEHAGRDLAVQCRRPLPSRSRPAPRAARSQLHRRRPLRHRCARQLPFITIKPGAYPWRNHPNAWRPAHIHLSLFGPSFLTRLVTQMYFPGDPLFPFDPIFNSVPDPKARERMICQFDLEATKPEWALGYNFDIVLRGSKATPGDTDHA